MNANQYPSPHEVAVAIRSEILLLMAGGMIPEDVTEFYQIHDYWDANMLGSQLFPKVDPDAVSEAEWTLHMDRMVTILNAAQEEVNVWLLRR